MELNDTFGTILQSKSLDKNIKKKQKLLKINSLCCSRFKRRKNYKINQNVQNNKSIFDVFSFVVILLIFI